MPKTIETRRHCMEEAPELGCRSFIEEEEEKEQEEEDGENCGLADFRFIATLGDF